MFFKAQGMLPAPSPGWLRVWWHSPRSPASCTRWCCHSPWCSPWSSPPSTWRRRWTHCPAPCSLSCKSDGVKVHFDWRSSLYNSLTMLSPTSGKFSHESFTEFPSKSARPVILSDSFFAWNEDTSTHLKLSRWSILSSVCPCRGHWENILLDLLALEDSCCGNCRQAHAVSNEYNDVFGNVCVWGLLEREFNLIFTVLKPEVLVFFRYWLLISAWLESCQR